MTRTQIATAVEMARSNKDLELVDDTALRSLDDFQSLNVPLPCVAKFIRRKALLLNGQLDHTTLEQLSTKLEQKVSII